MPVTAYLGGIGGGEMLLVFVVFLLFFGAKKLPSMARAFGRAIAEFQRAARDVREEFLRADEPVSPPPAPPEESPPAEAPPAAPAAPADGEAPRP